MTRSLAAISGARSGTICAKSWYTTEGSGSLGSSSASLPVTMLMIVLRSSLAGAKSGIELPLLLLILVPSRPGTSGASVIEGSGITSVPSPKTWFTRAATSRQSSRCCF